jgi:hypothetical protein
MATLEEWSAALWAFYYPETSIPRPVYLSMDDEDLLQIDTELLGVGELAAIKQDLVDCVLDTIQLGQINSLVFAKTDNAARSWYHSTKGVSAESVLAPPQLPFLAVTVLAASDIGGDASDSLGFYRSLRKTLGLREEFEAKISAAYAHSIEGLWGYLNQVLIDKKYRRGIPTATAPTQRYVSIPVSQSILRAHDRRKLTEFFTDADLRPDSVPSASELEQLFDWWLHRGGHSISVNLENLWGRGKVERAKILEVIAQQLEHWDGSLPDSSSGGSRLAQVKVFAERDVDWFGKATLRIGLAHQASNSPDEDVAILESKSQVFDGALASRLGNSGFFSITAAPPISGVELLFSEFEFRSEKIGSAKKIAKAIYVLRFNPELQCFIESGKPNLGEPLLILASQALGIAEKVKGTLANHADDGLTELAEPTHGLKGWRVFQDVRFIYPFSQNQELAPLSTNPNASLGFSGGLKLMEEPGVRVWSRHWLPTIDATIPGSVVTLKVFKDGEESSAGPFLEKVSFGRVLIDLRENPLMDGFYKVVASAGGEAPSLAGRRFAVRSEASPRAWEMHPGGVLGYVPDSALVPVWTTSESVWAGFPSSESRIERKSSLTEIPTIPQWGKSEKPVVPSTINVDSGLVDPSNCTFSGQHRWELETCTGGRRYVNGVCSKCKAQRRELCAARLALKKENSSSPITVLPTRAIPLEIEQSEDLSRVSSSQIRALDGSLRFLQQGTYREVKEAASSIGLDAIQTRKMVRWLEVSGSIEIENQFSEDATWSLNPAALVSVPSGGLRLTGNFTRKMLSRLGKLVGSDNMTEAVDANGVHISLGGLLDPEVLATELDVSYVANPVSSLIGHLGPLTEILKGRSLEQLPEGARYEKFDSSSAGWSEVSLGRIGSSGSYRIVGSFSTSTFYVPEEGVERSKGYRLDAIMAKYMDGFMRGRPLVAYNPEDMKLYVPLGMELPGLLGRFAVSASGMPPKTVRRTVSGEKILMLKYENISEEMATVIYDCLGGMR